MRRIQPRRLNRGGVGDDGGRARAHTACDQPDGRTAQARGGSEAVRRYGATLIRDHEAADKYLKQYADEENVDVNGKIPPRVEAALQHAESELANLRVREGSPTVIGC